MFGFVEGVIRWHNRVVAYAVVLATDRYLPFRLALGPRARQRGQIAGHPSPGPRPAGALSWRPCAGRPAGECSLPSIRPGRVVPGGRRRRGAPAWCVGGSPSPRHGARSPSRPAV